MVLWAYFGTHETPKVKEQYQNVSASASTVSYRKIHLKNSDISLRRPNIHCNR